MLVNTTPAYDSLCPPRGSYANRASYHLLRSRKRVETTYGTSLKITYGTSYSYRRGRAYPLQLCTQRAWRSSRAGTLGTRKQPLGTQGPWGPLGTNAAAILDVTRNYFPGSDLDSHFPDGGLQDCRHCVRRRGRSGTPALRQGRPSNDRAAG